MLHSELIDFLSEHPSSLQELLSLFDIRVERSPLACINEPVCTLLFVLEELRHIKSAINNFLGLSIVKFLELLASFPEDYFIISNNDKAMLLIY